MTEPIDHNLSEGSEITWYGMRSGTVLADRYRIEKLISRGGMGAVFVATQLGLDRSVAVKILLPTLSDDQKVHERFRREARSAASLRHPNIIQIYDYGISDHGPYLVMEYLTGKSLRQILRENTLGINQAVELIEQICAAISVAHTAGIIHRDLKPDNIMIEEHNHGQYTAKVLDFGIAKIREAHAEQVDTNLTGTNIIGSPAYMSPEQSLGLELDARSDIYSLGIMLYEMLTGSTPFGKASPSAILARQIHENPRPVRESRKEISAAIETAVMKALAKDRESRFETVTEFAESLRLAIDDPDLFETRLTGEDTLEKDDYYATSSSTTQPAANGSTTLSASHRHRLAILPLKNLVGDAEIDYLGFALADSVITQLAPIKSLIVRPSSAIEKYRNQMIEPRTVGRELQVESILSGSYLRSGDLFRVNVQLIDVRQNEILWQERIDLKYENVIVLQDRICEELIRGLKLQVSTDEQEAIKRDEAHNPLAYEFYLRGLGYSNSLEGHKYSLEMLEASIGLDPLYAPAWAALAGRYLNARGFFRDETMFDKAEIAARKALELNPQLPAAHFWLAVYYGEKGDLKNALATCKHLLQASPNSEYAYQAMGHAYDYAGLPDVALTLFRKAAEINPVSYPHMVAFIHYQKGEFAEARREFERQTDVCHEMAFWLSVINYLEGDFAAAIQLLEPISSDQFTSLFQVMPSALLAIIRNEKDQGVSLLDQASSSGVQLGSYHYLIFAELYAQLGELDKCLEMLRGTIKTGYGNYPFLIKDPMLEPVRQRPEFIQIAEAVRKLQSSLQLMLVTG